MGWPSKEKTLYIQFIEVYQGLGRLWYYFYEESNSDRSSMETVYICCSNWFELLFVW